jgi:hypothetical protein
MHLLHVALIHLILLSFASNFADSELLCEIFANSEICANGDFLQILLLTSPPVALMA